MGRAALHIRREGRQKSLETIGINGAVGMGETVSAAVFDRVDGIKG
jgi:hypothetical protein